MTEVIGFDPTVSRTHTKILFARGKWWVQDLQSANGTYVDGEKVERVPLGRDTKISLGVIVHHGDTEALRNDFRIKPLEQIIGVGIEVNRH